MLIHPEFDPVAIRLGPLAIHWYGLSYLTAFILFVLLGRMRLRQQPYARLVEQGLWRTTDVEDLLLAGILGVILGGRLGYVLFYKPQWYLSHPLDIFKVWEGGMSFHGGLLGVLGMFTWFAWRRQHPWLEVSDFVAPCVPSGLATGRMGNFINGELWGREADASLPWAMAFPQSGSMLPRHPSQLYQVLLEGLLLFIILWLYARKAPSRGKVSAAFLMGYGALRFIVEYFREPDDFLGLLGLGLSMGQWLCLPMMAAGMALWWWAHTHPPAAGSSAASSSTKTE